MSKKTTTKKEVKLSVEDTREISKLARLKLTAEEEQKFTLQLNNILGYFDKLNEVNTDNIEPRTHPTDLVNSFRDDVIIPSLNKEDALKNAPYKEEGFFKAPKIV